MRTELIDIADLTDSREMMSQKTPRSISWFILIVTVIVIAALLFSYFGEIETYIQASGEIRPIENVSTVTVTSGGKISNIAITDGEEVNEGDVVLQLDTDYYDQQKTAIEKQLTDKKAEVENYNALINAIKNDTNCFDETNDSLFYYQYENYRSEIDNAVSQIEKSNNQIQTSINEYDQAITQTQTLLTVTTESYDEYYEFYNVINKGDVYSGNNQALTDIYNNYQISLDKAQAVYDGYALQYESVCQQNKDTPELVTEMHVEEALHAKDASYADLLGVKSNLLIQLNGMLDDYSQQIQTYKVTIEDYTSKKEALVLDSNLDNVKDQIKEKYYLNINTTITSLKQEIDALEGQLLNINETIAQSCVVAEQSGVLLYSQEYSYGDSISSGTAIATIVPTDEIYRVVMYIPESSITQVEEGQKVEYIVGSISSVDFGKIYGTMTEISDDSFVDQSTGQKYYKAIGTVPQIILTNNNGETRKLKNGMMVEVHAITGEKSILSWLLEKLNFL